MSGDDLARVCYICKKPVMPSFLFGAEDSWYMLNVAPNAASGGTMLPVHYRCKPMTIAAISPPQPPLPRDVAELVKRLRSYRKWFGQNAEPGMIADAAPHEAADTIERLSRSLAEADALIDEFVETGGFSVKGDRIATAAMARHAARTKEQGK